MVDQMKLLMLYTLVKTEYKILDAIVTNPWLSDNEIENLLLAVKSLSDEINNQLSTLINKQEKKLA